MSDDIPDVCLLPDMARVLRTSERTIKRLRQYGRFPIPELPTIDKRPRWSGAVVRRFVETGDLRSLRRVS